MVCNLEATAQDLQQVDKRIQNLNTRLAKAPAPEVYAPEVAALRVDVAEGLRAAVAHGGDHDADWVGQGMPESGAEFDAWQTSQDITAAWQRRKDAIDELEKKCAPKPNPKDPDGATTTPQEALLVRAEKANAA